MLVNEYIGCRTHSYGLEASTQWVSWCGRSSHHTAACSLIVLDTKCQRGSEPKTTLGFSMYAVSFTILLAIGGLAAFAVLGHLISGGLEARIKAIEMMIAALKIPRSKGERTGIRVQPPPHENWKDKRLST